MFTRNYWHKTLLAILAISPFLAACGDDGSGKDSNSSSGSTGNSVGGGLLCFAYLLVSGNDECLSYIGSGSSGSGSSGSSGGSGSSGSSGSSGGSGSSGSSGSSGTPIAFRPIGEYEPNNDFLNANPVEFPRTTDRDGFIADGDVHDVHDHADIYTFTRTFLRYHAFRLCSDGRKYCDASGEIDTLTAYIDILDQSGRVIASSQASDSNYLRLQLAGGVPHYARVVAGDTMATTVRYHLVVHEANY